MRRIAIVKPDHVGDLVLASPAISWLASQSGEQTLFVQQQNVPLARHMFPNMAVEAISFGHLTKGAGSGALNLEQTLSATQGRDLVVFLRTDEVINRERVAHLVGRCIFPESRDDRHETVNQRYSIRHYFGDYDSERYWVGDRREFPRTPRTIGLCLGSGFPANKWSITRWTELGRRLVQEGISVRLIGGPQERSELEIVAKTIGLDDAQIVVGGADIGAFLGRLREIDVVVASDGGSGHLCSLVVPVLSIAASVPFRRFAPFGRETRVLSLDLPCSPCLNAHSTHVNLCFSHECSFGILAEHVLKAIEEPRRPPGTILPVGPLVKLFYGLSHATEPVNLSR